MLKIKVLSRKRVITDEKGKEKTFYTYFSPVEIEVFENGESKGFQKKYIDVHFTKVATKKLPDDKVFAIIGAKDGSNIQLPFIYEVKVNSDGVVDYPTIWVRDFDEYTPLEFKPRESTCTPIIDEEDTESVEITE